MMILTRYLKLTALVAIAFGMIAQHLAADAKPNILFIFADDHSYEAIGAYQQLDIDTPNLDRLVSTGTSFSHTYNMGAWGGAVCVASRAMLNTGRFVWRAKSTPRKEDVAAERMWSQQMKQAGYKTYMTGKWHVSGISPDAIFDVARDVRGGMPRQTKAGYNRPLDEADYNKPGAWKPWDTTHGGFWQGGKHWSEIVGDNGIAFIEDAAQSDTPFFMYLAFNAPHDPRQAPKKYVDLYPLDRVECPENMLPQYPHADAICGLKLRDERLSPYPRTDYGVKINRQEYFAIITHMDAQIGRILKALEKSGKAENTYIFFTADHGLAVGRHGLLGKQNMYEHSMRVPFMVVGPGVKAGHVVRSPIYLQDVVPTSIALAGKDIPDHVEFKTLLPALRGDAPAPYDAIYGAYMNRQRMVVKGDFKLIVYPTIKVQRLYNLAKDPLEMNDLAANPEYTEVIKRLNAELSKLKQEMGDPLLASARKK